jgi:hypothetical protein
VDAGHFCERDGNNESSIDQIFAPGTMTLSGMAAVLNARGLRNRFGLRSPDVYLEESHDRASYRVALNKVRAVRVKSSAPVIAHAFCGG